MRRKVFDVIILSGGEGKKGGRVELWNGKCVPRKRKKIYGQEEPA